MNYQSDILIGGGGTIGLACAAALVHENSDLHITILDKNPQNHKTSTEFDGRNIALNAASIRFFKRLDIWENLKDKTQPIHDIIVSDGTLMGGASGEYIHFDANKINQESFGEFALNTDIHAALIEYVEKNHQISLQYHTDITHLEADTSEVILQDQHKNTYKAKLLIAADGKNSFIRQHFDIEVTQKFYGQTAIVFSVAHDVPHHGIAQEFFLPSGPFAILPLKGNKSSLVWSEQDILAQALLKAPKDVFHYELMRRFGSYLGDLRINSPIFSYPLMRQITQQMTAQRTAFIGDSAHVIHPISGQGFNLGLRDIGHLSDLISQHLYAGLDIGADVLLNDYQKARKADIMLLGQITNGLNGLFSNDCFVLQKARRFGIEAVENIPKLRDFFSKGASEGTISELPSLLAPL